MDSLQITEHAEHLAKDKSNKKAREGYIEASRSLEMIDPKDLTSLAETMFKGSKDAPCIIQYVNDILIYAS